MGTLSDSCLRGSEPDQNRWSETVSAHAQAHWCGLTSPNSDLVTEWQSAKEGTLLAHQQGANHLHPSAAAYPSLLTHHCSQHGGQRPPPCPLSPAIPQVVLILRKGTFIVSYSELPFQLHTAASAAGTGSSQPVSKTTAPPNATAIPVTPGPWPPGLGAGAWRGWGKGASDLYSSKNSPCPLPKASVCDSALRKSVFFLGILRPAFTSPVTGGSLQRKDVCGLAEVQDARAHRTSEGRKARLREAHHWTARPPARVEGQLGLQVRKRQRDVSRAGFRFTRGMNRLQNTSVHKSAA